MDITPRKRQRREATICEKSLTFFEQPPDEKIENGKQVLRYKCKLCDQYKNGTKMGNLSNHLETMHPSAYSTITNQKESLPIKRLRILQNAVEIVSVNGRSFQHLLDSGYQKGIRNKLKKLQEANLGINFSNRNLFEVKEHLSVMAEKVRAKIKDEVRERVMSLMVDIVTKNKRSILGISVQYIINGKLKIRSLGMIELKARHTGKYLAELAIARLQIFGIDKRQILTITTDNGKNVLKMIRDINDTFPTFNSTGDETIDTLNEALIAAMNHTDHNESERVDDEAEWVDGEIERVLNNANQTTEEEALQIWAESALHEGEILQSMSSEFSDENQMWDTTGVNCSAHTLQLAVKESIKAMSKTNQNVLKLGREIVKFLALESTRHDTKEQGMSYTRPQIDCTTRWGSTCMMVG